MSSRFTMVYGPICTYLCDFALCCYLQEAISSASSVTQTISGELADGQRKLVALAAGRGNSSAVNPIVTQLTNGPLGGLHEKVCSILDLSNTLQ